MQQYKNEDNQHNDVNKNDQNVIEFPVNDLEELFINFQKDLKNPQIEEEILNQYLLKILAIVNRTKYILPNEILISIFELLSSPNPIVAMTASKLIEWSLSFYSEHYDILLEIGLLDFIMENFPNNHSDSIAYTFIYNHPNGRDILIECGYLDKLGLLLSIQNGEEAGIRHQQYIAQLIALVKTPFEEIHPDLAQSIFDLFEPLATFLEENNYHNASSILSAYHFLLKSNEIFYEPFILSKIMNHLLSSKCDDTSFISKILKLMNFLCNQNDNFSQYVVEIGAIEYLTRNMKIDIDEYGIICSRSIQLITDIMFHCPESISQIYFTAIPEIIADMLYDDDTTGRQKTDLLSFIIVMMVFAPPAIYVQIAGDYRYYQLVAENILSVDFLYRSWALRVLYRGFMVSKQEDLITLKEYLVNNDELIEYLENLDDNDDQLLSNAKNLLAAIFEKEGE